MAAREHKYAEENLSRKRTWVWRNGYPDIAVLVTDRNLFRIYGAPFFNSLKDEMSEKYHMHQVAAVDPRYDTSE